MFPRRPLSDFFQQDRFQPEKFDDYVKPMSSTAYKLALHQLPHSARKAYLKYLHQQSLPTPQTTSPIPANALQPAIASSTVGGVLFPWQTAED